MNMEESRSYAECPFCQNDDLPPTCQHFIGWTDDGKTLEPSDQSKLKKGTAIKQTDIIRTTGVSARVYRGDRGNYVVV